MATATASHIRPARSHAAKLARPTTLTRPVRTTARHDADGDVAGIFGGSGVLLVQAGALMPGLLPGLLLAGAFALPLVLPVVALGLVVGIFVGLPLALWRLVKRLLPAAR